MAETRIWAILVAAQHATQPRSAQSDELRLRETRHLIARARSMASTATTCAVVAPQFLSVEEYERIQNGRYQLPSATQVDVTA